MPKLVMSSSPSTRFDGSDIDGLTELEMPRLPQSSYLQEYAETKAKGASKDCSEIDSSEIPLIILVGKPSNSN